MARESKTKHSEKAICVLTNKSPGYENINGVITLEQKTDKVCTIIAKVSGLPPGKHGFHIHNKGDLTEGCTSLCSHYNPFNRTHGGPCSAERHAGDLGNIEAGIDGDAYYIIEDDQVKLYGPYSVIGRSFIIHKDEDDLGMGTGSRRAESLKTGNAGKRICCGVIGRA